MKAFNGGSEIRISKEDLISALEYVLNNKILNNFMDKHKIESLTLHPESKYVVRLEIVPVDVK